MRHGSVGLLAELWRSLWWLVIAVALVLGVFGVWVQCDEAEAPTSPVHQS